MSQSKTRCSTSRLTRCSHCNSSEKLLPLTADDLARIEHRARRWQNSIGTVYHELARDVFRLLAERERLLQALVAKDL